MSLSTMPLDGGHLATNSLERYELQSHRVLELWSNMMAACAQVLDEQRRFYEYFPAWKRVREETIKELKETADLLDKQKRKVTIARLIGSSSSFLGGITSVTSATAALVPLVPVVAAPLVAAAPVLLFTAGAVTSLGSVVGEVVSKKAQVETVKRILEKDRNETECLKAYQERSLELISAIENVMSIEVFKEILEELQNLFREMFTFDDPNLDTSEIQTVLNRVWPLLCGGSVLDADAEISLKFLICGGYLVNLISMFKLHKNSHSLIFEGISATIKVAAMFAPAISGCVEAAAAAQNVCLVRNQSSERPGLHVGIDKIALSVGVALDCYAVYRAVEDLCRNSPSPCATQIRNAVTELEKELRNFAIAYGMVENMYRV